MCVILSCHMLCLYPDVLEENIRSQDLVIHGITVGSRLRSIGCRLGGGCAGIVEVIGHLRVKLLCSLLCWARVASNSSTGPTTFTASSGTSRTVSISLRGSRLRLCLGLAPGLGNALAQSLGCGDSRNTRGINQNLNLHWLAVDKQTIQSLEGFACTVGIVKGDVGDAAADTVWPI